MTFKNKLKKFWFVYKEGIIGGALVGIFVFIAYTYTGGTFDFAREAIMQSSAGRYLSAGELMSTAKLQTFFSFLLLGIGGGILVDHLYKPGK